MLAERLRDPELRAELERMQDEICGLFVPAAEGFDVNPGPRRPGRLVDAAE
jgi:hypothetical protein